MGEISEMMLDGTVCQYCGVYLNPQEYGEAQGIPRTCADCWDDDEDDEDDED